MSSEPRDNLPADLRRGRMLEMIIDRGFMRVADLSAACNVSDVTVRSDLDVLGRAGGIRRVHGGAMPLDNALGRERSFEESLDAFRDEKRRIGGYAASLVLPGSSVFIDVGTTTAAFARALVQRDDLHGLTLVTNSLSIALALESSIPRNQVIVTGGTLRPLQHSLVAPLASLVIESLHVDLAVIGCNGVDSKAGVTNVNVAEAELKRSMVDRSGQCMILADGSKIGRVHLGRIGALADFSALVTGASAEQRVVAELEEGGLRVERA